MPLQQDRLMHARGTVYVGIAVVMAIACLISQLHGA